MNTPTQLHSRFETYLQDKRWQQPPHNLYEPANYIMQLGGKRLRPLLLLMSCDMFGGNIGHALDAALSVEIFHNFSLVHDDIMDAADKRRGKPAVHIKYGLNAGILSGDVMLVYAYKLLENIESPQIALSVYRAFNKMAVSVCEGQQMDTDFEIATQVSREEYLKMIGGKTAALTAACLEIGAHLGGADKSDVMNMHGFGHHLGIAFQILDDVLDAYGNEEKVGKKKGGDIIQNKKTFLFVSALELADEATKQELLSIYAGELGEQQKIEKVMYIYDKLGIEEYARSVASEHEKKAQLALESVAVENNRKQALKELSEKLLGRMR